MTLDVEAGIVDADRAEAGRQFIVAAELAAADGCATVVQLYEQRIVAVLLDMISPAVAGNGEFLEITDDDFRSRPQGHRGLTAGFDIAAAHHAQIADNSTQPVVDDAFAATQIAVRAQVIRRKADPVKHYVIMPAFAYSATALRHCHCPPPFLPPAWASRHARAVKARSLSVRFLYAPSLFSLAEAGFQRSAVGDPYRVFSPPACRASYG